MKKYNYNFSIVTPGGCSSSCSFCTDPFNEKWSKDYIKNLTKIIFNSGLHSCFTHVSVTGGEPTQSPLFRDIMQILYTDIMMYKPRFSKRVLTTNGWRLAKHIDNVAEIFNHVNISRHAIGDEANFKVFGGKNIATDEDIKKYCSYLGKHTVDVNLNHVYSDNDGLDISYVQEYINYAKSLNATKVTFRYDQNTNLMEKSELETFVANEWKEVEAGGCPVCREACYLIDGMYVTFKNSCAEPTNNLSGELYELIYHVDGNLYKDWGKKLPYKQEVPVVKASKTFVPLYVETSTHRGSGGCGSGGCG